MELRMSRKERDRLKVMAALAQRRMRQKEASRLLRLSERQARRILARYRAEGDAGLVHRARGRPSNRRLPEALRRREGRGISEPGGPSIRSGRDSVAL